MTEMVAGEQGKETHVFPLFAQTVASKISYGDNPMPTDQHESLRLMQNPHRWPRRPWLPVMQPEADPVWNDLAFGVLHERFGATVFLCNLMDGLPSEEELWEQNYIEFPNFETLVEGGWCVD